MSSQQKLTIMILEDNAADVFLLKEGLREAELDFTPVVFKDGESAFTYIDAVGVLDGRLRLDAAILDLNVPKRDGSEVLAHIRQSPLLRHLAVIIVSSSPRHVMMDRAAHADCYITKPDALDQYLAIGNDIRRCIEAVREASISTAP
jgi:two-component system, chemotaxis family, response regulator Rcp1